MKTLADNIKYYRNLKGWSQEDMADKLGVSLPTYSRIERNINTMPYKRIVQVAKVLGITVAELVTIGKTANDLLTENKDLKKTIIEKDKEINLLQKRIIELLDKKSK